MDPVLKDHFFHSIQKNYLFGCCFYSHISPDGKRYIDPLWHQDLMEHLTYIESMTVIGEVSRGPFDKSSFKSVENEIKTGKLRFVDICYHASFFKAFIHLPYTLYHLSKEVKKADIVHTSLAGYPFPLAWVLIPLAKIYRKKTMIVVESAFWRTSPSNRSFFSRIAGFLKEKMNTFCINRTDLSIFTHQRYLDSLLTKEKERGHVIPAAWVNTEDCLTEEEAKKNWSEKLMLQNPCIKVIYVGKLSVEKGFSILLDAMKILKEKDVPVHLTVLGEGNLKGDLLNLSAYCNQKTRIMHIKKVAYGKDLYSLLQKYHALILPTLSDEQTRILFDAFSQALPVIASNSAGNAAYIKDHVNGVSYLSDDPEGLAKYLEYYCYHIKELETMGLFALNEMIHHNHRQMHRTRMELICRHLL